MAFTQNDLSAIDAAIASGELKVTVNGRAVEYRSVDDLIKARATIQSELASQQAAAAGAVRPRTRYFTFVTARERY